MQIQKKWYYYQKKYILNYSQSHTHMHMKRYREKESDAGLYKCFNRFNHKMIIM